MNSMLAALLGGVGSGATTYGNIGLQQQREEQARQQRMAELKQQEDARLSVVREQQALMEAQKRAAREAGVNSIKTMFPDFQAPEGDFDPQVVLRAMLDREATNRYNTGIQSKMDLNAANTESRFKELQAKIDSTRDLAGINNAASMARLLVGERGKNARDDGPKPAASLEGLYTKFLGEKDEFGKPTTPGEAMQRAREAMRVLTGGGGAPTPQYNTGENALAKQAQQKIQSIMNDASLSPEDKQDMVQQVNDRLRSLLSGMRGGR